MGREWSVSVAATIGIVTLSWYLRSFSSTTFAGLLFPKREKRETVATRLTRSFDDGSLARLASLKCAHRCDLVSSKKEKKKKRRLEAGRT